MEVALTYFHELFTTSKPSLLEEAVARVEVEVSEEMNQFLAMPFTALEVKEAIFQMGVTKSLGSNDMLAYLFQKY